mmetsp:Transcript_43661/g.64042  ORF Transcript_43661/g.64042 Transcript_43661/m.64042 type:complete len:582 (-) Transcript_43661:335-2080(-)
MIIELDTTPRHVNMSLLLALATIFLVSTRCNGFNLGSKLKPQRIRNVERNHIIDAISDNTVPPDFANEFDNLFWKTPKNLDDNHRNLVFTSPKGQNLKRTLFTRKRILCDNHGEDKNDYHKMSYNYGREDRNGGQHYSSGDHGRDSDHSKDTVRYRHDNYDDYLSDSWHTENYSYSYSYNYSDDRDDDKSTFGSSSNHEDVHTHKVRKDSRDHGNINDEDGDGHSGGSSDGTYEFSHAHSHHEEKKHSHDKCANGKGYDDLISSVSCDVNEKVQSKLTPLMVSFQYCVETKKHEGLQDIVAQLESAMLTTLSMADVLMCPEHRSLFKTPELKSSEGHGRMLAYGNIVKITSDPKDVESTDGKCEPTVDEDNIATEIDGALTIYYPLKDDGHESKKNHENKFLNEVLTAIEEGCDEDAWVHISDNLVKVIYLGSDDEEEAIIGKAVETVEIMQPSAANRSLPLGLAAGFGLLAIILLAFLLAQRKTEGQTERTKEDVLKDFEDDATDVDDHGMDEYTISPEIIDTDEQSQYDDVIERPEYGKTSLGNMFGRPNYHNGLDVHQCTSASCKLCQGKSNIQFVNL